MDCSNPDVRWTCRHRRSQEIPRWALGGGRRLFCPIRSAKEMRSTSYNIRSSYSSMEQTDGKSFPFPPCPCSTCLFSILSDSSRETNTKQPPGGALMLRPTVSHPHNILTTSLTPIAGICRQIEVMRHISESRFQNRFAG